MAFVVVQHMSDTRKSLLPELLQRSTAMPVSHAKDGSRVKRDHVYVIPPDKNMQMVRRTLRLLEKPERPYIAHSINLFSVPCPKIFGIRRSELSYPARGPTALLELG